MERQRQKRVPSPFNGLFSTEGERGFLRFTGQLDQHRKAEDLLQALPSTLHSLISAHTFMVVHEGGTHQTLRRVVASQNRESLSPPDLSSQGSSAYRSVFESQEPLIIPSIAEETRFRDSLGWFHANGDRSLCIFPLRTALRRLGVICVGRSSEHAFSEEDISLLALAADHAALALDDRLNFAASEEARLQLENERTKLKLVLDLNNSVVSNLELKDLVEAMSPSIRKVMQLDAVALMLPAADGGLEVYALDFPDGKGQIRPGAVLAEEGLPEKYFVLGSYGLVT